MGAGKESSASHSADVPALRRIKCVIGVNMSGTLLTMLTSRQVPRELYAEMDYP